MKCGYCDCTISNDLSRSIYRSCDKFVCSPKCSTLRINQIMIIDPTLTNPTIWDSYHVAEISKDPFYAPLQTIYECVMSGHSTHESTYNV